MNRKKNSTERGRIKPERYKKETRLALCGNPRTVQNFGTDRGIGKRKPREV